MKVYVGGTYGSPPTVVAVDFEKAVKVLLQCAEQLDTERITWTCEFLDSNVGDKDANLRWTADANSGESRIYVESFDIE